MKYSFWKGLLKTLINLFIFLAPLAVQLLPSEIANVTLSGAIYLFVNYLKVKNQIANDRATL